MDRDELNAILASRIGDERVLAAMAAVDRELFVPPDRRDDAWRNEPLPIGGGQTISQPLVVALMCVHLELSADDLVLDVGTGSGYHAAVLAQLAGRVISVERNRTLVENARANLEAAGVEGVTVFHGDGSAGRPEDGPFNAINVTAACRDWPPPALVDQLAAGGRMVAPVGGWRQRLLVLHRVPGEVRHHWAESVAFVPLTGGLAAR